MLNKGSEIGSIYLKRGVWFNERVVATQPNKVATWKYISPYLEGS